MNTNTVQHETREPAINTTLVQVEERVAYKDVPMGRLADEIERISVDGRPAFPQMGPRRIRRLVMALVGVILVTGVLVAMAVDRAMGLGMAAFGVLLFITNPEFWATVARARERRRAQRQIERSTPPRRIGRRWGRLGHAPRAPLPLARARPGVAALQHPTGIMGSGENTIDVFMRWNA